MQKKIQKHDILFSSLYITMILGFEKCLEIHHAIVEIFFACEKSKCRG